jgi:hypothetical protein
LVNNPRAESKVYLQLGAKFFPTNQRAQINENFLLCKWKFGCGYTLVKTYWSLLVRATFLILIV